MEVIGSIARQAYRQPNEPLNILTFVTHERYQSMVAKTGHNFYAARTKDWIETYAPLPENFTLLHNSVLPEVTYDLIWCLAKTQVRIARNLSQYYHVPLLMLEVFVPDPSLPRQFIIETKEHIRGHVNVFLNKYSRDIWGWNENDEAMIIEHGVDINEFKSTISYEDRHPRILTVVNQWQERDWSHGFKLWQDTTRGLRVFPLGDNGNLSNAVPLPQLIEAYQQSQIFYNTTLRVPVPTSLIEAMACGCAIVSTNTAGINEFIEHGVNGLLGSNSQELRQHLINLLNNKTLCAKIGEAARQTAVARFNIDKFKENWNEVFKVTANTVYRGEFAT